MVTGEFLYLGFWMMALSILEYLGFWIMALSIFCILAHYARIANWRCGKTRIGDEKKSRHQIFVTDVNVIGDVDFSRHQ